jgi:hypothetical protein
MKKLCILFFSLVFLLPVSAQESTFNKGDLVTNLGLGLGSRLYYGSYYKTTIPRISVSAEKGIVDGILDKGVIGVGGYLGLSQSKWEYNYWGASYGTRYTSIVIGPRGAFHYPIIDKLDTYAGLMLGLNVQLTNDFGANNSESGINAPDGNISFVSSWFLGGRYYLTDNIAAMGELGVGISYLTIGVAIKL